MPRELSSDMLAALEASVLQLAVFVEAQFQTGTVNIWTGNGPITWNGIDWLGAGSLLGISVIEQGLEVKAKGISLELSGIDSSLLADVLQETALGNPVTIYVGLFSGGTLISSPYASWQGRMDQSTIEIDGDSARIQMNCETRLMDMDQSVERRYTQDDQQRDWPGDLGFQFVLGIQEVAIIWGTQARTGTSI